MRGLMLGAGLLAMLATAHADETNGLTWKTQVAGNYDAILNAQLERTRMADRDPSLRTVDYFKCLTDDGYGRKRPCSTDYP